jgi:hypothetical protein
MVRTDRKAALARRRTSKAGSVDGFAGERGLYFLDALRPDGFQRVPLQKVAHVFRNRSVDRGDQDCRLGGGSFTHFIAFVARQVREIRTGKN